MMAKQENSDSSEQAPFTVIHHPYFKSGRGPSAVANSVWATSPNFGKVVLADFIDDTAEKEAVRTWQKMNKENPPNCPSNLDPVIRTIARQEKTFNRAVGSEIFGQPKKAKGIELVVARYRLGVLHQCPQNGPRRNETRQIVQ